MKNLLKQFKTLTIASLALSLFIGFSLASCSSSNTNEEGGEATEESTMESAEEGHEHPSEEGHEHPSDGAEETATDSTAAEAEHPAGEHPSDN